MAIPLISALPTAPSRSRPNTFATEGDAFLGAMVTMQSQTNSSIAGMNAVAQTIDQVVTDATAVANSAATATAAATTATTKRDEAVAAAVTATQAANSIPTIVASTTSVKGIVELATAAEAAAGTDTTRALTPQGLRDGLNAIGNAPVYGCRAWVNFDGQGTVAIRASGNVSSITDNGIGDYTVSFTNALSDTNYACVVTGGGGNSFGRVVGIAPKEGASQTTSSIRLYFDNPGIPGAIDIGQINAAVFR